MPEMEPYAKIICDSISERGFRVTTMEVQLHRFVLAELNTHRVFSRNSASSRAIPFSKQLEKIGNEPAVPLEWRAEQSGMQGGDILDDFHQSHASAAWHGGRKAAMRWATKLAEVGIHKSIVNRMLEPYMSHKVIITSTAWGNFFAQRDSTLAQPEIAAPAKLMHEAYMDSIPVELDYWEWHLPYITKEDHEQASLEDLVKISAARCARVSYLTHDGTRDLSKDLDLYNKLIAADPPHWSPLEHPCKPWDTNFQRDPVFIPSVDGGRSITFNTNHLPRVGNFLGFLQHRTQVEAQRGVLTFM